MPEIILITIGAIVIGGFAFVIFKLNQASKPSQNADIETFRRQVEQLTGDLRAAVERAALYQEQVGVLSTQLAEKEHTIVELNRQIAQKTAENEGLAEKFEDKKAEISQLQERFQNEFRNLANEILEEKTQKFTEQNKTKLDELLKPLGERIKEFERKVDETYDKESKQRFSLEKEIKNLADLNQQISNDAKNLTTALTYDTKKQGNWGELILERVLESSGLVRGQEYTREVAARSEQGEIYRPDVIVNLPDNKHIIIDAKVTLVAYTEFTAAITPEEQEKQRKLHLLSIRSHVKMLSEKNYQQLGAFDTPDYVLLFMPIESAFSLAIQSDPDLFNFAWEKNVVIVSPTTLLATLKTVASIWKHEKQTQNAFEIARQGGHLYDKFVAFLADLEKIGNQIDTVRKSYDEAHKKLKSGNGNLIGRVEKLRLLGAKTGKEIPRSLLEKSEEDSDQLTIDN